METQTEENWLSIMSKRGTPKEALSFNFSEIGSSESITFP